ncbi:type II toxin-antitoxin system HicB family antitoxin [Synechococcus sp. LA31]|nr:type II toxin-antitoxin system HicB family antitoxin [Synechococcus sp. LA31]
MNPAESHGTHQPVGPTFTYSRESDGRFWGYLNSYSDHWTQGDDLEYLKEQFLDLYREFAKDDLPGIRRMDQLVVA